MQLSSAKSGTKVVYNNQRGEIVFIPSFSTDKTNKNYNCVEVEFNSNKNALGELINLSDLTEVRIIEVTEKDLITCDSDICSYCSHHYNYEYNKDGKCENCSADFSNFLGVEAYRTKEDE